LHIVPLTVTFDQFNASLQNKSINVFFKKNKNKKQVCRALRDFLQRGWCVSQTILGNSHKGKAGLNATNTLKRPNGGKF